MNTKNNVKIDKEMLDKAMDKAKRMNIALNAASLVNFMLHRVVVDGFKPTVNCLAFGWEETHLTTMYWKDNEKLERFKKQCEDRGLRSDHSFMYNLLIWNFLNKYNV